MEEKELWTKKWKERLEGYSEPVPVSGWEQLEKRLVPQTEKRLFPHRRWIAAAASVLLAVSASLTLYFIGSPLATQQMQQISFPVLTDKSDATPQATDIPTVTDEVVLTEPHSPLPKSLLAKGTTVTSNTLHIEQSYDVEQAAGNDVELVNEGVEIQKEESPVVMEQKDEDAEKSVLRKTARKPSAKDKLHLPENDNIVKSRGWSLGASVSNAGAISGNQVGTGPQTSLSRLDMNGPVHGVIQIPDDKTLVFQEGVPYLQASNDVIDIKHRQPVSFGLSFRKSLPKGFSVETGLTYTLLSADIKLARSKQTESQRLHYLGIPIRANWNIIDKKLLTLYLSGGGAVEKCVYAEQAGDKLTVKPLQLSVMAAVGTQINLTQQLGVYLEPGIVHFFNDGSKVQTIRKDNPVNFNLQAGFRFTY